MVLSQKQWRNIFLFCLGLFLGTAFCMKWLETRFYFRGELFTIIGLEISYTADEVMRILWQSEPAIQTLLKAHLYFDFVFMAGAYGGIASLCMMARYKVVKPLIRTALLILAWLQLVAWGCDIRENLFLLDWMQHKKYIGTNYDVYHFYVIIKWVLAISGACISIPVLLWRRKN
jgi:hypothetical protein